MDMFASQDPYATQNALPGFGSPKPAPKDSETRTGESAKKGKKKAPPPDAVQLDFDPNQDY
jgi:hypothetical protein